jgi:hypothetical protein
MKRVACCALLVLGSCDKDGTPLPGVCSLNFNAPVNASFSDESVNTLLESAATFNVAVTSIDNDVRTACNDISTSLGGESSTDTETACMNADTEIRRVLMENADASLVVEVIPAVCRTDIDAYADCVAECDASFDVMATPVTCMGGEIIGGCTGMCTGSCTVDASATCEATCRGMCSAEIEGTCSGTCMGECDGTCSAMDGSGMCMGVCNGTCMGMCDARIEGTCSGTCMGECTAMVTGSCTGECTGMCDVMFTAPRCEGGDVQVEADAECTASCEADVSVQIDCTEPSVAITFTGSPSAMEDLEALVGALERNLPRILRAAKEAEVAVDAAVTFSSSLEAAAEGSVSAGVEAVACLTQAVAVQAQAALTVQVSFEASVMISGSAGASGG